MECIQFHPTGMVWPLSVRGLLVTEGVRGDGGVLRNSEGERFMFNYVADMFRAETAESEEEADKWYDDHTAGRRPPELLPRDEVARAINAEVKAGRGTPHGGVYLDIASRRTPEFIRRRLPSMYHQFMELAGVDITRESMEIGPTCHYIMGGVKVDADTAATAVPGLFAAGEVAGGMHGANRLGGNSLSDLVVFGRRAGMGAADYVEGGQAATSLDRPRSTRRSPRPSPLRARRGREPLRHPARPPRDDAGQRRHHPHRVRARRGHRQARRVHRAREEHLGQGRTGLQPRLEPRDRPAEHADGLARPSPGRARCARSRAAATPARTSRRPTPSSASSTSPTRPTAATGTARSTTVESPLLRDARRAEGSARGGEVMADVTMRVWRGDASGGDFENYTLARTRARSSSTSSTASRRPRRRTSRAAGTARPASAARARRRSTASPASCA